jgi:hypothetical protein
MSHCGDFKSIRTQYLTPMPGSVITIGACSATDITITNPSLVLTVDAVTPVGASGSLSGSNLVHGVIVLSGGSLAFSLTFPEAATIATAMGHPASAGKAVEFKITNNTIFNATLALAGPSVSFMPATPPVLKPGCTINGTFVFTDAVSGVYYISNGCFMLHSQLSDVPATSITHTTMNSWLNQSVATGASPAFLALAVSGTAVSTGPTSGALTVAGGAGLAKTVYLGESLYMTNATLPALLLSSTIDSATATDGGLVLAGGLGMAKTLRAASAVLSSTVDSSTNLNDGGLILSGGVSVAKSVHALDIHAVATTESASLTEGCMVLNGGLGVAKAIRSTNLILSSTVDSSTSLNDGSFVTPGGASVAKSLHALDIHAVATTDSASITEGCMVLNGGLGVAKTAHTLSLVVNSTVDSTGTSDGSLIVAGGLGLAKKLYVGASSLYIGTNQFVYTTTTQALTFTTTMWTGDSAGTFKVSKAGNQVNITWPTVKKAGNTASSTIATTTDGSIPSSYRPTAETLKFSVACIADSVTALGILALDTNGALVISSSSGGAFANNSPNEVGLLAGGVGFCV